MRILGAMIGAVLLAMPALAPAQTGAATASPAAGTNGEPPTISVYELIERVAKKTGKRFIIDPHVSGLVPLSGLDVNRVDYATLLAVLRAQGYATFTQDGIVNVMSDASARQFPVPVVTTIPAQTPADELVTVLVSTKSVCTFETVPILRPLMPQSAHLAAFPSTNSMLISDRAANARRIVDLLERLDKQAAALNRTCVNPEEKTAK